MSLDSWVLVKANLAAEGPEHQSAALDVGFGMVTWMAIAVHAIGVEFYVCCPILGVSLAASFRD